jgi:RND family efflux transporter MFP subunit
MRVRAAAAAIGLATVLAMAAWGQGPSGGASAAARVETAPLELTAPDRYQVPVILEPARRASLVAPADGMLRALNAEVGAAVRAGQEVAQLDRTEAAARLKIAEAAVKEMDAELDAARQLNPANQTAAAIAAARLEGAQARVELAQLDLDRCSLRAPFAGRVLASPLAAGQFVPRGAAIAEVADVTGLRALVPVDRSAIKEGGSLDLVVEGRPTVGRVRAILPLPESFATLRELATPWAAAWVAIDNVSGTLEPGQRVRNPFAPAAPIATIPSRAVHAGATGATPVVQVLRDEYVHDIPVQVLGSPAAERTQVAGAFRPSDAVIVESSVPLAAGTLVHFGDDAGASAAITPPVGGTPRPSAGKRIAPIGAPDSAVPKPGSRTAAGSSAKRGTPATKPAAPKASAGTPF